MNKSIKKMTITGCCIALGIILPMAFHMIPNAGSIFLPMHIPVLLCGILCGWQYGAICGILTPFLSSTFTGMPPAAMLPAMMCELFTYGLTSGLLSQFVNFKNPLASTYTHLVGAMLAGRIVSGIVNALIFRVGNYSLEIFLSAALFTAIPGILIQLIIIPILMYILKYKSKVI